MTGSYERAIAEAAPTLQADIVDHPFLDLILRGDLTEDVYAAYLRETYHLARQMPCFLSAAAAQCGEEDWLQGLYLDLAREERRHDRLCIQDLEQLGYDTETYLACLPGPGAWAMVGQNHWVVTMKDPAALLGFAGATEGLGAAFGPDVDAAMVRYPFAEHARALLRVHVEEDHQHVATVRKAFNRAAKTPQRYELMLTTWTYTLRSYGQLFSDAMVGTWLTSSRPEPR